MGELLFGGVVWGSIAAVLVAFGYLGWLFVNTQS
jgi:hypothetical protein